MGEISRFWYQDMKFVGPNITRISSTDEKDWSKKVKWPAPDQTVVSKGT